jgi:uracil phosphoribosyltransferase
MGLTVVEHPLVAHRVAQLRHVATSPEAFRRLAGELATFLIYEAGRHLSTVDVMVPTPLGVSAPGRRLSEPGPLLLPILRAGLGLLDGVLAALPAAEVGLVGLRRDEVTFEPALYLDRLPAVLAGRSVIVLDPMLATGGSLHAVCKILRDRGAGRMAALCLIAAPAGVDRVLAEFPDVDIVTAALDPGLNDQAFIVPGLGDAGDRLFGPPP